MNVASACAVTQLPATQYGDSTVFRTLRDGYDQMPITLVKQFEDMQGLMPGDQRIFMNHQLARIELGEGEYP